jgi:transposase
VTEEAFKVLKSSLEMRPRYHQEDEDIRGHIYICILALIIKQYLTFILKKHKIHSEDDIRNMATKDDIHSLQNRMMVRLGIITIILGLISILFR